MSLTFRECGYADTRPSSESRCAATPSSAIRDSRGEKEKDFGANKTERVSRDSNEFARLDGLFIIVLNCHRRRAKKSSGERRKIPGREIRACSLGSGLRRPIRDDCPFIPDENCLIQTVTRQHARPNPFWREKEDRTRDRSREGTNAREN